MTVRRPLKTTFDMTTLIFSAGGCPSCPFYYFKRAPGTIFAWQVTENPCREVATKDHLLYFEALKGEPPDLKTKVDDSKVDVKGFPTQRAQQSKKCNFAQNCSISIKNFNLARKFQSRRLDFTTKIGPRWVARSKFSFSLEIFNLARNLEFF